MSDKGGEKSSSNTDLPSLDDILKRGGVAHKSSVNDQNEDLQKSVKARHQSLDKIKKKGNNAQGKVSRRQKTSNATNSSLPDIEALVSVRPQGAVVSTPKTMPVDKAERSLDQIMDSFRSEDKKSLENPSHKVARHENHKVFSFALIGLLAAIVIGFLISQKGQQQLPESVVAQKLMDIVKGIEKYQLKNDRTPKKLSDLPEFPENAVEWPVDRYQIQLEASALELFYFEDMAGYVVMSRYGDEAWMYTEKGEPVLRQVPAR